MKKNSFEKRTFEVGSNGETEEKSKAENRGNFQDRLEEDILKSIEESAKYSSVVFFGQGEFRAEERESGGPINFFTEEDFEQVLQDIKNLEEQHPDWKTNANIHFDEKWIELKVEKK